MKLTNYIKFLKYLFKHKYLVFKECVKLGIIWRGITHDFSKFSKTEFKPYTIKYFSKRKPTGTEWEQARLHHLRKNPHHYQYHVIVNDEGITVTTEMSETDVKEMLADWLAMSKNDKKLPLHEWYEKIKDKIILHPKSRKYLEKLLYERKNNLF